MFTGRLDRIDTMRQYEGLNGFLLRTESEHDCYGAGHAGTALSAALGMAVGRDLRGTNEHVVVVAGDAALTCGISYEALNNVEAQTKRFIVVLNDNEWSIAKNVGAIAILSEQYRHEPDLRRFARQGAADSLRTIGGKTALHFAHKVEEGMKNLLVPSVIFEELGLRYYGPIDGHDIPLLIQHFRISEDAGRAGPAPHPDEKRQRLRAGASRSRTSFTGSANTRSKAARPRRRRRRPIRRLLGKTLAKFADSNQKIVAITARDAERHRSRIFPGATSGPLFRCRDRGGTRGALRVRARDAGTETIPHHLLDVHAARVRHDHS